MEGRRAKPKAGLIVSLIGGILIIIRGLSYEAVMSSMGVYRSPEDIMGVMVLSTLFGLLMIIGAVIGYTENRGRQKLGGTLVTIFSILNLFVLGLSFLESILIGIIGGILILTGK
jgi:uncharacterized membrane protein